MCGCVARTVILVLFLRFFYWVVATANGGAFSKKDSETQTDRQTDRQIERKKETERERERERVSLVLHLFLFVGRQCYLISFDFVRLYGGSLTFESVALTRWPLLLFYVHTYTQYKLFIYINTDVSEPWAGKLF